MKKRRGKDQSGGTKPERKRNEEISVRIASAGAKIMCASAGSRAFLLSGGEGEESRWLELRGEGEGGAAHGNHIKCVELSSCGQYLASSGDDKILKVWRVDERQCLWSVSLPKKVSSLAFSPDSRYVFAGDKFGDVWCVSVSSPKKKEDGSSDIEATRVLGHFCSAITCLSISPCGKYIASGDRDRKIRVSALPASPVESGIHEICSYCVGHESFVIALAFVTSRLLVSAGGDGTVRLWGALDGSQKAALRLSTLDQALDDKSVPVAMVHLAAASACALVMDTRRVVAIVAYGEGDLSLRRVGATRAPVDFIPAALALGPGQDLWIAGCRFDPAGLKSPPGGREYTESELKEIGNKEGGSPGGDKSVRAGVFVASPPSEGSPREAAWRAETSPWEGVEGACPVVIEDGKQVDALLLLAPELNRFIYPISERDFRKRNRLDKR